MKIIFCVRNYLPLANAVGVCISKISDVLVSNGYEVIVVAEKNDTTQTDEESINGVKVCRFISDETKKRLELSYTYNTNRFYYNKVKIVLYRMKLYLKALIRKDAINTSLLISFIKKLETLNIQNEDILVPVSALFESIYAAVKYKVENKCSCKIIPILYDLFKDCPFTNRGRLFQRLKFNNNKKIEQYVLSKCHGVLALSTWMRHLTMLEENTLTPVVEIPLMHPNAKHNSEVAVEDNSLAFCGNFDNRIRKTGYLVNVLEKLLKKQSNIKVHFYGNADGFSDIQRLHSQFASQVFLHGYIPSELIDVVQEKAQYLINVGNSNNVQIPSKIYRYMAMCKPIICFTEREDDLALEVMKNYPLLIKVVKNSTDNIDDVLEEMERMKNKSVDYETIEQLFITATPAFTADSIIKIASMKGD